jgi:hypothetical protein
VVRVPGSRFRDPGFDSRGHQIFWEIVGLERGPFSLVSKIEELLGRNSSGFGLENRDYGRGDRLCWPRDTLYPQKLALSSQTSGGRSVGIFPLPPKITELTNCSRLICVIQFNLASRPYRYNLRNENSLTRFRVLTAMNTVFKHPVVLLHFTR